MTDYASAYELKSYLRIPDDDEDDDAELGFALTTASELIDKATHRTFSVTEEEASARYYTTYLDRALGKVVVAINDLYDTTGITIHTGDDFDVLFSGAYRMYPYNAASAYQPYTHIVFTDSMPADTDVMITATYGWPQTPTTIKQATLLQAARIFKRRDAPFGIAGSAEMGNQLRLLAKLDPDVEVMVYRFKRWWSAV